MNIKVSPSATALETLEWWDFQDNFIIFSKIKMYKISTLQVCHGRGRTGDRVRPDWLWVKGRLRRLSQECLTADEGYFRRERHVLRELLGWPQGWSGDQDIWGKESRGRRGRSYWDGSGKGTWKALPYIRVLRITCCQACVKCCDQVELWSRIESLFLIS